jgi:hypothetical protein
MAQKDPNATYQANLLEALNPLLNALVDSVKSEHTPEMVRLREIYLRRLVFSGDVIPTRLPPPQNITEVGGYLNLLQSLHHPELTLAAAASAVGLAAPLTPQEQSLMDQDLEGAVQKALRAATGWVAACNVCQPFWKGTVCATYNDAQQQCAQHDRSKHNGIPTGAVVSL